jgi:hypothetical protein
MSKFAIITIGSNPLTIEQSESLSPDEESVLASYALPFGSRWKPYAGARSLKIFPFRSSLSSKAFPFCPDYEDPVLPDHQGIVCAAYTIISCDDYQQQTSLFCLAGLFDSQDVEQALHETQWASKLFLPMASEISDVELRKHFLSSLQEHFFKGEASLRFFDWFKAQFHLKVLVCGEYCSSEDWHYWEEYSRLVFLATSWQRSVRRYFGQQSNLPSITTLASASDEFTRIVNIPL